MYQLPFVHKKVLGYICDATANGRSLRGIDVLLEANRDSHLMAVVYDNLPITEIMNAANELIFLSMVTTKYVDQWQANTYHATELGMEYNRGSVMDRG